MRTFRAFVVVGVTLFVVGVWSLSSVSSGVSGCRALTGAAAGASSGIASGCARTVMGYLPGLILVVAGLFVVATALLRVLQLTRLDRRGEYRSVPRTWSDTSRRATFQRGQSRTSAPSR